MHKEKFMIYRRDAKKGEAKAVTMVEEPSVWISRRSGSGFLMMNF